MSYQPTVKLKDNEIPAAIRKDTGEVRELAASEVEMPSKPRNPNVSAFDNGQFLKHHPEAWNLLSTQTTKYEFAIAVLMSHKIKMITNSLEPLSDETTIQELAKEFKISLGKVKQTFDRLFKLGVYARFEVSEWEHEEFRHKKYWVFNPFLSVNGKAIDNRSLSLFRNTYFAKIYR